MPWSSKISPKLHGPRPPEAPLPSAQLYLSVSSDAVGNCSKVVWIRPVACRKSWSSGLMVCRTLAEGTSHAINESDAGAGKGRLPSILARGCLPAPPPLTGEDVLDGVIVSKVVGAPGRVEGALGKGLRQVDLQAVQGGKAAVILLSWGGEIFV